MPSSAKSLSSRGMLIGLVGAGILLVEAAWASPAATREANNNRRPAASPSVPRQQRNAPSRQRAVAPRSPAAERVAPHHAGHDNVVRSSRGGRELLADARQGSNSNKDDRQRGGSRGGSNGGGDRSAGRGSNDNEAARGRLDSARDVHKGVNRDAAAGHVANRPKSGDLDHLAAGHVAQKIKLAEQYRIFSQGDVARRLELEKHGRPAVIYHGVVSPRYEQACLKFHYWGPAFFAGPIWYPRWNPWVEWCWRYCCPIWGDPRPLWCRPIVYVGCPEWVYWQTPVWAPLPVVACGTWVDLRPVAMAAGQSDLQLVAVRFVDPGHPEENLGPRYRVWFRNNGDRPIVRPFNVMLFASLDGQLSGGLPQAGVRVTGIEAHGTQSVDIRLPMEVYAMGRDLQGNPVPFMRLHVLVDSGREVREATKANNGACIARGAILPIDPAAFELSPSQARPGGEVLLAGEGLGPQPGRVLVVVNGQEMDGEIAGWYDMGVRVTMPRIALSGPVDADLIVVRGDGAAANPLKITLTP